MDRLEELSEYGKLDLLIGQDLRKIYYFVVVFMCYDYKAVDRFFKGMLTLLEKNSKANGGN